MSLAVGTRLGPYEIVAPIGAGGMGEVYRARDTRLARTVAIKIVSSELTLNDETRARFRREAKTISNLAHPHICVLYDVGSENGVDFLVMEYLTGESLDARLARGPLSLNEILGFGIEITDALDHAHRNGIVHRDLKPANVMLTPGGAKLLDFGIARSVSGDEVQAWTAGSSALTVENALTRGGTVQGTLEFMAPEQLEGKAADARSDIFAFGNILFRMATGRPPFSFHNASSLIAAIREEEPKPVSEFAPRLPSAIDRLIAGCLRKDPEQRIQSAHDCKLALEWIRDAPPREIAPRSPSRWLRFAALLAIAFVIVAAIDIAVRRRERPQVVRRVSLVFPEMKGRVLTDFAISPDGNRVVVADTVGARQLYIRSLDQSGMTALPGTSGAAYPFFSPAGDWIGFSAGGKLKKLRIADGAIVTICDAPRMRGATWGSDDTIVFAPVSTGSGLFRVSASGGDPRILTTLDPRRQERSHRWPHFLPDGRHVLFSDEDWGANYATKRVSIVDLDTGRTHDVATGATDGRFVPGGVFVFARDRTLYAMKFDEKQGTASGLPVPVLDHVATHVGVGQAYADFSRDGTLIYRPYSSAEEDRQLVWVDRNGAVTPASDRRGDFVDPRLSPDGRQLLVGTGENRATDLWLVNLAANSWSRIAPEGKSLAAIWSPGGDRIYLSSNRAGVYNIYSIAADGGGTATQLTNREYWPFPRSVSPDGTRLIEEVQHPVTSNDLWIVNLASGRESPLITSAFDETDGQFSPDGQWLVYTSTETGRPEVYMQHFPLTGRKWQGSTGGGVLPRWSASGRELFFRGPGSSMMAAAVTPKPALVIGTPVRLFEGDYAMDYDVTPDGKRFIMLRETSSTTRLDVVLNWFDDVRRRLAAASDARP